MVAGQEANDSNLGVLHNNGMLSVLMRIASVRQF